MAEALAPQGYVADRPRRGRRPHPSQHLPHPREGGREGLFRSRPAARPEGARDPDLQDRRRRLRGPGRGRRDPAPRSPSSTSSSARRATTACPSWMATRRRTAASADRHRFPRGRQVRPPRRPPEGRPRADGLPHRAGRLRQVLHLLRRPLHPRRRSQPPGRAGHAPRRATSSSAACARSRCSARTSTPTTARARTAPTGRSPGSSATWPRSTGSSASATRPRHPNDMTDDLIAAHGEVDKLMPYLHLPVQSGSDRILKAMNRKHTAEAYLRLVERIRAARPDLAAVERLHRRLSRRDRRRLRGDARADRGGRLRRRPSASSIPHAPARPPPNARRWPRR